MILDRFKKAFNVLTGREPEYNLGIAYGSSPVRPTLRPTSQKTMIAPIINRMAIDISNMDFKHVRVDQEDNFLENIKSPVGMALRKKANIDQTGRAFIRDVVISLLDEGSIAIVPVITSTDPYAGTFDIYSLRVGKIIEWYPGHVRVDVYDERNGRHIQKTLSKDFVAIVENPLYLVMNEPNGTLQRLLKRLSALDVLTSGMVSGKLDLLIQLPYTIKTDTRRKLADDRKADLEDQLATSKLGIGYVDAAEKIIQLNRPVGNNILSEVEFLTRLFYSQIGISEGVFSGEASEEVMLNYMNSSIGPIATEIADAMERAFITQTAYTQGQRINVYRDPFKHITTTKFAEVVDNFSRNTIMTANEVRSVIALKPDSQDTSSKLINKNINPVNNKEGDNEETKSTVESP